MSKAKSQFLNIVWLFIGTGMLVSYPTPLSSDNRLLSTNSYTAVSYTHLTLPTILLV